MVAHSFTRTGFHIANPQLSPTCSYSWFYQNWLYYCQFQWFPSVSTYSLTRTDSSTAGPLKVCHQKLLTIYTGLGFQKIYFSENLDKCVSSAKPHFSTASSNSLPTVTTHSFTRTSSSTAGLLKSPTSSYSQFRLVESLRISTF